MKFLLVVVVILQVIYQISGQTPILVSDPTTTSIVFPLNQTVGYDAYHNFNNRNFTGFPAARWIYVAGSFAWPSGFKVITQSIFYVDCPQNIAQLLITADNNFTAYLNGALIGTGNNWQQLYTFNISLICGPNNLTIVSFNLGTNTPAAIVFAIVQDQTLCYQCTGNPSAFYNRKTCQCQCTSRCRCVSRFQTYFDYPQCGCVCNVIRLCLPPLRYFDQSTCACQCVPRYCAPKYYQNPRNCRCTCRPIRCLPGYIQNQNNCACVRV